jgi:hypothetical protein
MALSLTVPAGSFHLSGNPLWVKVEGALPPAGSTAYKVLLRIISVDGDLQGSPFTDGKAPASGVAWFDVSGYVDQPLEKRFEWPMAGAFNPYGEDTRVVTFQAGETWIDEQDNLVEIWEVASEGYFVVKGGVGPSGMGAYNDSGGSFYSDFVMGGRFLTRMPLSQVVHPNQPVKLWLLAAQGVTADLHIRATYEDGTTGEWMASPTLYKDIMHEINCLPYHSGWDAMPAVRADGTRMSYYEVWIEGVTEVRRFVVDHSWHPQCNFLFVLNSLGGVDVVWLSGQVRSGFDTQSVEATRQFSRTGTRRERTVVVASRTGRRTWRINSGWKSPAEMEALMDGLLTKQAWLLSDAAAYNSGTLYPVNIANTSSLLVDTSLDLQSVELELIEAHDSPYL